MEKPGLFEGQKVKRIFRKEIEDVGVLLVMEFVSNPIFQRSEWRFRARKQRMRKAV